MFERARTAVAPPVITSCRCFSGEGETGDDYGQALNVYGQAAFVLGVTVLYQFLHKQWV